MKSLLLHIFLLINLYTYCQNNADTLEIARQLNSKEKFKEAKTLLNQYCFQHPKNINGLWLRAQTSYYNKDSKESIMFYERALAIEPKNQELKQDYFVTLVNLGELKKSNSLLLEYNISSNLRVLLACAKLCYYQGEFNDALQLLTKIHSNRPDFPEANQLREDIQNIISSYVKLYGSYQTDDQPLSQINSCIEGNYYKNELLSLNLNYSNPIFIKDDQLITFNWLKVSNKFTFYKYQTYVLLDIGGIHSSTKSNLTANIEVGKIYIKHLEASLKYSYQPYLFTRYSLNDLLMYNQYSAQVGWNNINSWNGKANLNINQFSNKSNEVYSVSAWILAPPLKYKRIELRAGYSFNYSSSKNNTFTSKDSLSKVISAYYYNTYINGVYNPYFTPNKQQMHYAIITLTAKFKHRISISLNANIGIYGSAQNPYLYLDKNSANDITLQKNYALHTFYPNELKGNITYGVTNQLLISAEYLYRKNNFYTSNYFSLTILKRFWNEQKNK